MSNSKLHLQRSIPSESTPWITTAKEEMTKKLNSSPFKWYDASCDDDLKEAELSFRGNKVKVEFGITADND
jgi:hypothetical protein